MRFEDQRRLLVNELEQRGIRDEAVLKAFSAIPREDYVLAEYREYAYQNRPLPILSQQTISQPWMIAIMLSHLKLQPTDRVLEIGTGSGYQTALLASIVQEVCSVELLGELSIGAQKILKGAGFKNIYFRIGDGWQGWEKAYPAYKSFDKIVVSAAAESIPEKLCEQLGEGGIMAIPVGGKAGQTLHLIYRENGELKVYQDVACAFVPLLHSNGRG